MGESALEFGFYQLHRGADKHLLCPGDSIIGSGKRQLKSLAALLRFGFTSAADVVADTPLALLLVLLVLMLTSLCRPGWCKVVWTIILAAVVVIAFPALIGRPIGTLP